MCGGMLQSGLERSIVVVVVVVDVDDAVDIVVVEVENSRRASSLRLSSTDGCLSWWGRNRSRYWLLLTLLSVTFIDFPPDDEDDDNASNGARLKERPGLDVNHEQKRLVWFIVIDFDLAVIAKKFFRGIITIISAGVAVMVGTVES
mmetsp:Transcript_3991/g.9795  ORF Transcript_3991/g.9795 Transcript_3991/m.9795 type:complete len:146 (+) Transcript_3991:1269-1706(+)